ncbi:hypothetical protein CTAYLR_006884 [Chrysophaeum taylorii]|uniref:Pre-mRNA-splicing factor ISY1 n=1 Tax=Chrysophaeum taylorii TaxID=2483200 RepID=A0AAD7XLS0_9STRA|nr:hypothetical protein CTAYLR_006884 [Chrysophaeum taylorii]
MARNEEKSQLMLNKWVTMKKEFTGGRVAERRPYSAADCTSLGEAEKWRLDIVRTISRKVSQIQNAGLGEHKIRDLNDQINKLLRERTQWQARIRQLGGPDYNAMERAPEGEAAPGGGGYRYFGAARNLPGVKELFETAPAAKRRRTRAEMYKRITPDYYGFRDVEFHPELAELERNEERERRAKLAAEALEVSKRRRDKENERRRAQGEPPLEGPDSDDDPDEHAAMLAHVDRLTESTRLAFQGQHAVTKQAASEASARLLTSRKRDLLAFLDDSARDDDQHNNLEEQREQQQEDQRQEEGPAKEQQQRQGGDGVSGPAPREEEEQQQQQQQHQEEQRQEEPTRETEEQQRQGDDDVSGPAPGGPS